MRDAVLYRRVSTEHQATGGFSLGEQSRGGHECAAEKGLRIVATFDDAGVTASKLKVRRPGFEAMVAYLRAHPEVRDVIIEKINRGTRNSRDFAVLDELREGGVTFHGARDRDHYGPDSSPGALMVLGIQVEQAKFDSRNLALESKKGQRGRAEAGFYSTTPPHGYTFPAGRVGKAHLSPTIVPSNEAAAVVDMFRYALACDVGFRAVAEFAASRGLVGKHGRPLTANCVRAMLRNRVYIGDIPRHGTWLPGAHEAIVPRVLFDAVQAKLDARARPGGAHRGPPGKRPYSGMLVCDRCGAAIIHEPPRASGRHRYDAWRCSASKCPGRAFVDELHLDTAMVELLRGLGVPRKYVAAAVERVLATPRDDRDRAVALQRKVKAGDDKLAKLREALGDPRCDAETRNELFEDMRAIRDEQARLRRALDELSATDEARQRGAGTALVTVDILNEVADLYAVANAEERREVVALLLQGSGARSRWSAEFTGRMPGRGGKRVYAVTIAPAWRPCWVPFARVRTLLVSPARRAARTA